VANVSSYQAQFAAAGPNQLAVAPRTAIRPPMAYQWKEAAAQGPGMPTRSTAGDAYAPPPSGFSQLPSTKPAANYERAAFTGGDGGYGSSETGITTNNAMFVGVYPGYRRTLPIYPRSQRPAAVDNYHFDSKSTAASSYQAPPIARRQPIRPVNNGVGLGGISEASVYNTTSRASFVPHAVVPFKAAPKPQPTMGSLGAA